MQCASSRSILSVYPCAVNNHLNNSECSVLTHLRFGEEADASMDGIRRLHDFDTDISGAGRLGRASIQGDMDGIERLEAPEARVGDAGGAHQVLHGGGGADEVRNFRLYERVAGLGVALDDDVVALPSASGR